MIDPSKILAFLSNYFEGFKTLYSANKNRGGVSYEELERIFNSTEIVNKLETYQLVDEKIDGSFYLRDIYFNFIEGLLDDYTLDMPEQIGKFHLSLNESYRKLMVSTEKNETLKLLNALGDEIQKFEWQLKRNIKNLIKETQKIKANNEKLPYKQKLRKATELSRIYLEPLNAILSDHDDSIYSLVINVLQLSNQEQFINRDIDIKNGYKRLYEIYNGFKAEMFYENKLLNKEVLYLLERIKRESQILSGCINYLHERERFSTPEILENRIRVTSYKDFSKDVYYDARDVWDGFRDIYEDVEIVPTEELEISWLYDERRYVDLLEGALPIYDYYQWVYDVLLEEQEEVTMKSFLELTKTLYALIKQHNEDGKRLNLVYKSNKNRLYIENKIVYVPQLEIKGE